MGMILRIASSRIVGQGDIVGRSGYFSLNLSANSVMRGRLDARRTLKSLVADLRSNIKLIYNGFTAISQQIYPYIYSGKINILFAGRFVPQKGIPVLINIIKRVDEKVFYFHIGR